MPEKSARHNLSQTLYALRQILTEQVDNQGNPTPWLLVDRQTVQLNPAGKIDVDIHKLDQMVESTRQHGHHRLENCQICIDRLETALSLYRGDFLSGFYLEDSNEFEAWAEAVREAYRRKLIELLGTLADIAIQVGDHDHAIRYIDRQLAFDDLSERANHQKIEVLALAGRRVEAIRQYHEFARRLEDQLGTDLSQETMALYERIRSGDLSTSRHEPTETESIDKTTPRHNLVPQATPFIGRQEEMDQLDQMFRDPDTRLVTIIGPGGMGKTRLALACAEKHLTLTDGSEAHPYSDGIFFIPLADLENPEQISKEINTALNLDQNKGGRMESRGEPLEPKHLLIEFLKPRQMLLVLDNFEQLTAGSTILEEWLQAAPALKLLVTSRERLNLLEEQVFPISGLTFPKDESQREPRDYTAIQLFIQTARRIRPDFKFAPDDLAELTSICRLLDGMPLGLELTASWIDLLQVKEIIAEIHKSLDFLETDIVNIPERHRSLTAVCNASWEHLNDHEQEKFAQLSVFRGGFTRKAAQQVTKASLRLLGTLIKKSLLHFDAEEERYRFHPYLRQYASEKLAQNPADQFKVREAHSANYCKELQAYCETYQAGQPHIASERISKEYTNIQVAWDWAVSQRILKLIDKSLEGLCLFLDWNFKLYEGLSICQNLNKEIANIDRSDDNNFIEKVHARVIIWNGYFNNFFDSANTRKLIDEGLEKLTKLEESGYDVRLEKAQTLWLKANYIIQNYSQLEWHASIPLLLESLSFAQEIKNQCWMLRCLDRLSYYSSLKGSHSEARNWAEQGYDLAKKNHNQINEVNFLDILGLSARNNGEYEVARKYFERAIKLADLYKIHSRVVLILNHLGDVMLFLGRLDEAISIFERAKAIDERKIDMQDKIGSPNLCVAQWLTGQFENAEIAILSSINKSKHFKNPFNIYSHIFQLELFALTGRYWEATDKVERIADWEFLINFSHWPLAAGRISRVLSWISLVDNRFQDAEDHSKESVEYYQFDDEAMSWSQPYLALSNYWLGDRVQARELLTEAMSTGIQMQAYIPIVFTLPITLLLLVEENLEFAKKIYTQVRRDCFMSNAQLFHDLVYKHMPDELTEVNVETIEHSDEHREALWETAKLVHAYLTNG
jgi:predicted ATPase/DNA-binding SARP family transcriptional activator